MNKHIDTEAGLEHPDHDEDRLVATLDEGIIALMQFVKNQILAESIDDEVVTPPQFSMLYCLQHQGQTTMSALSQQMALTHGALTGMVDRLVRLKLVERRRSEEDRRVVYVSISERGQALIERMRLRRCAILKNIIKGLNPEERRLFLRVDALFKEKLKHVE